MGNWYSDKANNNIVVSTRIRLARNLSGIPFPFGMTDEMGEDLKQSVKAAIKESDTSLSCSLQFIDMDDVPDIEVGAMVERHIISPEFARSKTKRAIILSQDESISIMIGEEDHIRIQVILAGLQLEKAYSIAKELDRLLNEKLHFAFDPDLGYLTQCPTNLGTGLRASVMMHLPFCETSGELATLRDTINKLGFTVRGIYGEGSKSEASLYQISNQITLGISEENAIENLSLIASQLMEKEINSQGRIDRISVEDKVYRALGILENCRILESKEMMNLLSLINLGLRMGILKEELEPIRILIEAQPLMLMKKYGTLTPEERDVKRAEFVREYFQKAR